MALQPGQLSRRERQIMDVLFEHGEATAAEVRERIPDAPGYSAVRALLRRLEDKGHVSHREDGPRYVFAPVVAKSAAREGAARRLLRTFFGGSVPDAVAGLLGAGDAPPTDAELDAIEDLLREARARRGRGRS